MPFPLLPFLASAAATALGARAARKAAQKNYEAQKEFAQQGLRWRVEEAKAARISPLAALGFQGPHFSPSYTGQDYSGLASSFGSNSRSMTTRATQTLPERQMFSARLRQEEAKAKLMEFQSLALERKLNAPTQMAPPINEMGVLQFPPEAVSDIPAGVAAKQAGAAGVQYFPNRLPMSEKTGVSVGYNPAYDRYVTTDGVLYYAPNEQLSETLESHFPSRMRMWRTDVGRWVRALRLHYWRTPGLVEELRRQRPRNTPPGTEARWDHDQWAWRVVNIGPEGSQLFVHPSFRQYWSNKYSSSRAFPRGYVGP